MDESKAHEELAKLSINDDGAAPKTNGTAPAVIKENVNVVFVGHVDAGKSTMGGHILYLTGMVDKRTLEKFEKESKDLGRESWYLSWALDTGDEERAKGITVECGRAFFETDHRRFTILDAPGHKNYVPSMITGAAQADVAILVISARKGEFETGFEKGGQTREHATLVKTCGVKRLIVVVNKMDDPTVQWSRERYDEIVEKVSPFLKGKGYNLATDVLFMPISGFSGANLKDRLKGGQFPSYDGPSLLEYLNEMPLPDRKYDAPCLMPISGKYRDMGTIVTGKLEAGQIKRGQQVMVMPNRTIAEVLNIYIEETEVQITRSGDNTRLRLKGIEEEDISVGFVVCDPANPVKSALAFTAQLMILDIKNIIAPGFKAVMHIHTGSEEVTIVDFDYLIDRKTGKSLPRRPFVKQNDVVVAKIESNGVICMESFEDCLPMARFTLRDEGKTIAVGKVLTVNKLGVLENGQVRTLN